MKKYGFLHGTEEEKIKELITDFELKTGIEFNIAIAKKSDPYPAATLRFAILTTFAMAFIASSTFYFHDSLILIFGMFLLFFVLIPIGRMNFIKKFFFINEETRREVDEKAQNVFSYQITNKTTHKRNILLYISLLEKKLEILFDEEIMDKISQEKAEELIKLISFDFSEKHFYEGLIHAIESLKTNILDNTERFSIPIANEHPNSIIWLDF